VAADLSELRALLSTATEAAEEARAALTTLLPTLRVLPRLSDDAGTLLGALTVTVAALWDASAECDRLLRGGHSVKVDAQPRDVTARAVPPRAPESPLYLTDDAA
jgi:hypothetical protein